MLIRSENFADYADLNTLHIRAFDNSAKVATLVSLLRTRNDRIIQRYHLVAEVDNTGCRAGNVFSPVQAIIQGQFVDGC